jgi:hypothetical protein
LVVGYIPSTNGGRIFIVGPPQGAQTERAWDDLHKTIAELVTENEKSARLGKQAAFGDQSEGDRSGRLL